MKVLVAGWVGSANLGDELVFAGLRRLLAERGCRLAAISLDPDATTATHGVAALADRDVAGILHAAGAADALVFGGGGLLQDVTSPLNLPYHLARVAAARLRGTPFAAVGLGVGGLDTAPGRWLTRLGMQAAVGVSVRDAASRALLDDVGVSGARLAADLAFALDPPPAAAETPGDRLVVSLRPWTSRRTRLPAAARGDATPATHVRAAADALDRAAHETGLRVRFVALQGDRDHAFHARIAAHMTTPVERVAPPLDRLLDEYARARVAVSMRYHGAVAAILVGRPVVLVSYALKTDALATELGPATRRLGWDPAELSLIPQALTAVADQASSVLATRDRLRARQRVNAAVLDDLLSHAAATPRRSRPA